MGNFFYLYMLRKIKRFLVIAEFLYKNVNRSLQVILLRVQKKDNFELKRTTYII